MSRPTLIALSGSIRSQSFSTAILHTLAEKLADRIDIRVLTLENVPLYNQDLDTDDAPAGVAELRQAIKDADGVIIASPEYNHGISGLLKNALDWASRPMGKAALAGKTAFTLSSSPGGVGGARAHAQLNETLAAIGVRQVLHPQAVIPAVHEKIAEGRLTDQRVLDFLVAGVDDLLRGIAKPGSADAQED